MVAGAAFNCIRKFIVGLFLHSIMFLLSFAMKIKLLEVECTSWFKSTLSNAIISSNRILYLVALST